MPLPRQCRPLESGGNVKRPRRQALDSHVRFRRSELRADEFCFCFSPQTFADLIVCLLLLSLRSNPVCNWKLESVTLDRALNHNQNPRKPQISHWGKLSRFDMATNKTNKKAAAVDAAGTLFSDDAVSLAPDVILFAESTQIPDFVAKLEKAGVTTFDILVQAAGLEFNAITQGLELRFGDVIAFKSAMAAHLRTAGTSDVGKQPDKDPYRNVKEFSAWFANTNTFDGTKEQVGAFISHLRSIAANTNCDEAKLVQFALDFGLTRGKVDVSAYKRTYGTCQTVNAPEHKLKDKLIDGPTARRDLEKAQRRSDETFDAFLARVHNLWSLDVYARGGSTDHQATLAELYFKVLESVPGEAYAAIDRALAQAQGTMKWEDFAKLAAAEVRRYSVKPAAPTAVINAVAVTQPSEIAASLAQLAKTIETQAAGQQSMMQLLQQINKQLPALTPAPVPARAWQPRQPFAPAPAPAEQQQQQQQQRPTWTGGSRARRCWACGGLDHIKSECPNTARINAVGSNACDVCGEAAHKLNEPCPMSWIAAQGMTADEAAEFDWGERLF